VEVHRVRPVAKIADGLSNPVGIGLRDRRQAREEVAVADGALEDVVARRAVGGEQGFAAEAFERVAAVVGEGVEQALAAKVAANRKVQEAGEAADVMNLAGVAFGGGGIGDDLGDFRVDPERVGPAVAVRDVSDAAADGDDSVITLAAVDEIDARAAVDAVRPAPPVRMSLPLAPRIRQGVLMLPSTSTLSLPAPALMTSSRRSASSISSRCR
jgi:hypothetical protein